MYHGQPSLVRHFFKIKLADLQYCAALLSWLTYILLSFVVHKLTPKERNIDAFILWRHCLGGKMKL